MVGGNTQMTTDCGSIQESLRGYLEDSLENEETERVRLHLAGCPSCRSALEAEQRLCRDLSTLPEPRCPDTVANSIMRAVGECGRPTEQNARSRIPWRYWRWKVAFAAVLAVSLAVGFREWTRRPRHPETVYSEADLKLADAAIEWSLAFAAGTLQQAEKQALESVFTVPPDGSTITPVNSGGSKR
jgi:predicted anti-sigma-YlaC factor YlaD